MDSDSTWNGSNGSSVNAKPIFTNFGSVPFGSRVDGVIIVTSERVSNYFLILEKAGQDKSATVPLYKWHLYARL